MRGKGVERKPEGRERKRQREGRKDEINKHYIGVFLFSMQELRHTGYEFYVIYVYF